MLVAEQQEEKGARRRWGGPLRIFFFPSIRPFVPVVKADKECKHRGRGICHTSIGVRIDILRERETEARRLGRRRLKGSEGKTDKYLRNLSS